MFFRKVFGILLVMAMVLGLAVPALAAPGKGKGKGQAFFHQLADDLDGIDWAEAGIARVMAAGLMKGAYGKFNPQKPITQAEAVITVVRLLELETAAQSTTATELFYGEKVPSWASGYVAVAASHSLLPPMTHEKFQPNKPASRAWIAALLVKAAGGEAEAAAQANAALGFSDADAVPASLRGYVAAAVARGFVQGYPNGTFKPNKPVSRAEMAVLLHRVLGQQVVPGGQAAGRIKGTLVSIDTANSRITVQTAANAAPLTLNLAQGAALYLENQAATLANLRTGMKVDLRVNDQAAVIFLNADLEDHRGTVVTYAHPNLTLKDAQNQNHSFTLDSAAQITKNGAPAALAVNDEVTVAAAGALALRVTIHPAGTQPPAGTSYTGVIAALAPANGNNLALMILSLKGPQDQDLGTTAFQVANGAPITYGTQALTFSQLAVGDRIAVAAANGVVTSVVVQQKVGQTPNTNSLTGIVIHTPGQGDLAANQIRVVVVSGEPPYETQVITVAANAQVLMNGQQTALSALAGARISITLASGVATHIVVVG